ncbi:uncharacterized protein L203_101574 [Cryptococcus depauperatus CBS 7841]|uniref:E3 ubiquitin-protein ligase PEP5 n=1 Tax=Cryptococcus depauperatus CBS 7841 TaxID=1295531 RepID=A0A1E3IT99_9TREE|nr:vacuolar membrane protein [Cryptococcus depauperatus CBS 7841]
MEIGSPQAGPSAPQWRQFSFFDVEQVQDVQDMGQSPRAIRELTPPTVFTVTSPGSPLPPYVIVSSSQTITLLDKHFTPERVFNAWEGSGRATALLEAGGLLVGIGEEGGSLWPVLKVWDLAKEDIKNQDRQPVLLRNVRIQHGQRPHPVSSVALTTNLSHLAIGLGDGTVLLYRHFLQSLTTSPSALTVLPKARVVHESHEPVTGLGFREQRLVDESSSASGLNLFIVTTNRVLSVSVSGKSEARALDELGCGLGCAVMDWERREMIVARDEAIYFYGLEGRGAYYAYEGPKLSVSVYRHNLIMISPPFHPTVSSAPTTIRQYAKFNGETTALADIATVTIFDLQNKIVSYSGTYRDGVRDVVCQWGAIYIYGDNGKLSRLEEHSTQAKLEVLYRRNFYTLAISLGRSQGLGEAGVADIHRRYGDYLYGKGDFEGAMGQFVMTLGHLQPSYVIRKFLDAQQINNLTTYLQELHSRGLANPDHTTLLLNCYTKTSDRARLDQFIKTKSRYNDSGEEGEGELPFDLDTAIRVCRQAGFFEHATYLAKRFGKHEDYLRIQIEDVGNVADALRYLRGLGPAACEENMVRYGRTLLHQEPEATTSLLIDLCSGNLGREKTTKLDKADGLNDPADSTGRPAVLSYLGYNKVTGLFTGDFPSENRASSAAEDDKLNGAEDELVDLPEGKPEDILSYEPPSPRQYFAHFVDHRNLFIYFLESVALNLWNQKVTVPFVPSATPYIPTRNIDSPPPTDPSSIDQRAVWNTLIELYLSSTTSSDQATAQQARDKALALINSEKTPYDPLHALMLCSTVNFKEGMVRLWEGIGMYEDVLRCYMEESKDAGTTLRTEREAASKKVFEYLELYGPSHRHLYPLVLQYLTSSPVILSSHAAELTKVLEKIDEYKLLPPLAVVQLLSRNGTASVGNIKEWLKSKVEENEGEIESDQHLYESYRSETDVKRKALHDKSNEFLPEVFQVTRCALCGTQLDLPIVHFMCKHSYHQRCLSDSDPECIICARQHSVIQEIRRNQLGLANRHDLFLEEVHQAEDGFGVVADAFGRGLFGRTGENQEA